MKKELSPESKRRRNEIIIMGIASALILLLTTIEMKFPQLVGRIPIANNIIIFSLININIILILLLIFLVIRNLVKLIFERLELTLHPEKTRKVDLTDGKEGFDFLGCHLHKRMSGRLLEKTGNRWYYLQRWPSTKSMKRVRGKVHDFTDRSRNGVKDVKVIIDDLNPVLRGWGNYFCTGNASRKFNQLDGYVYRRLHGFMVRRRGRNLRAGQAHVEGSKGHVIVDRGHEELIVRVLEHEPDARPDFAQGRLVEART